MNITQDNDDAPLNQDIALLVGRFLCVLKILIKEEEKRLSGNMRRGGGGLSGTDTQMRTEGQKSLGVILDEQHETAYYSLVRRGSIILDRIIRSMVTVYSKCCFSPVQNLPLKGHDMLHVLFGICL